MKSTILLTALVILAFNWNTGHRNNKCTQLQGVGAYIEAIAAREEISVAGSFVFAEDTSFVSNAIRANREEIMMAQLAMQKSTNPQIQSLAQRLINDFKAELGKTQNADIKNLISKSLPIVSDHLRQLEALRNKMM